jgi:hypothetical protein
MRFVPHRILRLKTTGSERKEPNSKKMTDYK